MIPFCNRNVAATPRDDSFGERVPEMPEKWNRNEEILSPDHPHKLSLKGGRIQWMDAVWDSWRRHFEFRLVRDEWSWISWIYWPWFNYSLFLSYGGFRIEGGISHWKLIFRYCLSEENVLLPDLSHKLSLKGRRIRWMDVVGILREAVLNFGWSAMNWIERRRFIDLDWIIVCSCHLEGSELKVG